MSNVDVERVVNDEVEVVVVDGINDATGIDAVGNDVDGNNADGIDADGNDVDGIDVVGIVVDGNDVFGIVAPPRNASMRAVRAATPGNSCG